ncbi:murein L,D-transpeptidase catalytic domain-containing protein [Dysgonomonas sp. 511]|uniref:murein L,D-transpeptidase catalytic domain-containing protein n=1 Tax=Dysgonomonas sp. 511 TaxID=2302930 RepID=UPI0013D42169|nr:murein L,D-transpeptidase catalytic domain family protein [Dysgonomonas sp. 511]NDV77415.1 peptidase [Dysgonomonas sp. 511]
MNEPKPYTLLTLLLILCFSMCSNASNPQIQERLDNELAEKQAAFSRLKAKADSAMVYCKTKGLNTDYCILIDFSIHSGKNRIFVWDFANDTIKYTGLCCHGYGQGSTGAKPVFSNTEGSYCSSLGKYKLGIRSYSNYGINAHYKMHGLEKTNSNAFRRIIVLHSHTPVPDHEIHPRHLPLGWSMGCPVVSNRLMKDIDALLKKEKKPLLMWIYT